MLSAAKFHAEMDAYLACIVVLVLKFMARKRRSSPFESTKHISFRRVSDYCEHLQQYQQ